MVERGARRATLAALSLVAVVAGAGGPAVALGQQGDRGDQGVQGERSAPARGLPYAALGSDPLADTIAPPLAREFRAVWVASVSNIDWPSRPGLPVDSQKVELLRLLDVAEAVHLNAIILQVRPAGDALYQSRLEPWSYFLTGQQGRAPQPMWDPLAFAVTEAHRRGMELHAWFNPYRAGHPADTTRTKSPLHLSRTNPAVVHPYGPFTWMDPGEPVVRKKTVDVVLDVVRRYDIDGVHIDDYFYPYPERTRRGREIPFPDERSWRAYKSREGTLARDDWRRQNVDQLVEELYTAIKRAKPWVKFGISPFGIWRPGFPESVRGFDAYDRLYADSRKWLMEGWVDYWTPQLYWKLSAPQQSYRELLAWWRTQNHEGRNIWPGNYTSRSSARRNAPWSVGELLDQVQETRAQLSPNSGNVHFSMDAFLVDRDSMNARLANGLYAPPALVPPSPWLASGVPDAPVVVRVPQPRMVELDITRRDAPLVEAPPPGARRPPATPAPRAPVDRTAVPGYSTVSHVREPHWWVVRARYADGWYARIIPASERSVRLPLDANDAPPAVIAVSAVDHAGVESLAAVVR
ncbi:MAG: family 10 glycosylhydrolase [Gemmatimonadaceae bacterium]